MKTTHPDDWFKEIYPKLGAGGKKPPIPPSTEMTRSHYLDLPRELLEEEEDAPLTPPDVEYLFSRPPQPGDFYIPSTPEESHFKEEAPQSQLARADEKFLQGPFVDPEEQPPLDEQPPQIYDPENVEYLDPSENWLKQVDPDLIVDEYHKSKIQYPPLPPFKPVTEEDECLPVGEAKKMMNFFKETKRLSSVKVYFQNVEYNTQMTYNVSSPHGYIKYLHIEYPINVPYYLSLNMMASLDIMNGENYLSWLAEKLYLGYTEGTQHPPSVVFFSFQLKAKLVYEQPRSIQQLTVTSPVYCTQLENFQKHFVNCFVAWLDFLRSKTGNDEYSRWFVDGYHAYNITDFIVLHFVHFKAGGCGQVQRISKKLLEMLVSPNTRNNYCFFGCLLEYEYFQHMTDFLQTMTEKLEFLRERQGQLPLDLNPVFFDQLPQLAENLNINLNIYTEEKTSKTGFTKYIALKEENKYHVKEPAADVHLFFVKRNRYGHFYHIKDMNLLEQVSCGICYDWFYRGPQYDDHTAHCRKCPDCKHVMSYNHKCRRKRQSKYKKEMPKKDKKQREDWDKNVWFADFETYTKGDGTQHVYCAAIVSIAFIEKFKFKAIDPSEVICERFWGDNCIELFVEFLLGIKIPMTIVFYNGCRFDYYFLVQEFIRRKIEIEFQKDEKTSMISILRYKKLRFLDLYRFTCCSLAAACNSFKVPKEYSKGDFDHSLVKDMATANLHAKDIVEYCKYDVISLGVLYYIVAGQFFSDWKVSLKEFVSLPHLAYEVWKKSLPKEYTRALSLPTTPEYEFLRGCLYGGRVYCGEPRYFFNLVRPSLLLEYWPGLTEEWKDNIIKVLKKSLQPLKIFDYTSLYPHAAQHGPYLSADGKGFFPCGNYEWVDPNSFGRYQQIFDKIKKHQKCSLDELNLIRRCFFEVDITCPDDIDIPVLLGHEKAGKGYKMIANLLPKQMQGYSGYMLEYVLSNYNYTVIKIHRILKYGLLLPLLCDFMADVMKKKDDAAAKGDEVARNIAKSMANSSTGKFSQAAFERTWKLWFTDAFLSFLTEDQLEEAKTVIETFFNGLEPAGFYVGQPNNDAEKYTKCPQIGVCILDWAKIIMDRIMRLLGLHQKNKLYYTDTDSIIIKKQVYKENKNLKIWGSTYGLMKEEHPNIIWTEGIFWAPKTYALLGIDKKTKKVVMMLKGKGIPQSKELQINGLYYIEDLDKNRKQSRHDANSLKYIMFHKVEDGHVIDESIYLPYDWLLTILINQKVKIMVRYGSFKKYLNFEDAEQTATHVRLLTKLERTINDTCWWNLFDDPNTHLYPRIPVEGRSYPVGHKKDYNKNLVI